MYKNINYGFFFLQISLHFIILDTGVIIIFKNKLHLKFKLNCIQQNHFFAIPTVYTPN